MMGNRDPLLNPGVYRLEVVNAEPGRSDDWAKVTVKVLAAEGDDATPVGSTCVVLLFISVTKFCAGRWKSFVAAALGFADDESYDAYDPEGLCMDAALGESNEFSAEGNPVVGMQVDADVSYGAETADGTDRFRNVTWYAIEEQAQA